MNNTKTIKGLVFQIEVNRQRLQFAVSSQNESLTNRTSLLLAQLHASYFDETREGVMVSQTETKYLVFCELYPDGRVMSRTAYSHLLRNMDECDKMSHVVVEVDAEAAEAVAEVIELTAQKRKA